MTVLLARVCVGMGARVGRVPGPPAEVGRVVLPPDADLVALRSGA